MRPDNKNVQVIAFESPMRWSVLLIPLLLFVLSGCAMNRAPSTYDVGAPAAYSLDTGDVVRVTVYGDDTLTNTYNVTDKGTIAFPLVGQVNVRGQTIATAERRITELLANGFMISPKVSVEMAAYRPFFIEGAIAAAGQYPYVYGMTGRAAVATAGGFAQYADRRNVTIYRRSGDAMNKLSIGLDQPILPGDTIVVAERWL